MLDKTLLVKLRKETLAPFSDCIEALKNAKNDLGLAKQLLSKKSILKSGKNSLMQDDEVPEGKVKAVVNSEHNLGFIFVLRAQTDFVTNSREFLTLQEELTELFMSYIDSVGEFRELSLEEALNLSFTDGLKVHEKIASLAGITREKIKLSELIFSPKESEEDRYLTLAYTHHNLKLAVLMSFRKAREIAESEIEELKKLVIHYAGSDAVFLGQGELNQEWVEQEEKKLRETLAEKKIPEGQLEKIISKQLEKRREECTFSSQTFILDPSLKISQILDRYSLSPIWAKKVSL